MVQPRRFDGGLEFDWMMRIIVDVHPMLLAHVVGKTALNALESRQSLERQIGGDPGFLRQA